LPLDYMIASSESETSLVPTPYTATVSIGRYHMEPLHLTDPVKIKAATTYNSAADHFDDTPLAFWSRYGHRTVERLNLQPGSTVLDVGCGTGASALPAAEIVGPNGSVTGVDLAEKLLEQARAKAAQRHFRNVSFRMGDMTALGFPDGHFDAVISVFSVFFVPDMEVAVRELWRMIKPGGKLAITTWGPRFFEPVYTIWREAVRAERPDLYSVFNPWDRITSPDQLRQLVESSGVVDAEIVPESGNQPLHSPQDWWTIVLGSGLRGTVDAMDRATAARIQNQTVSWVRDNGIQSIETNVIYAAATKS
jgi:ubiquinone/menaquinone biosynthesis C-methylase UbiE